MGVFGHPFRQLKEMGQDGWIILQGAANGAQTLRGKVADLAEGDDDTFLGAGAEGHLDPLAEGNLHAGGDGVGEGMRHVFMNDVHDHLSKHSIPLPSLRVEKFSTSAENVRVGRYAYNPQTAK